MKALHEMHQNQDECHQTDSELSSKIKIPCEVYSRVVGYLRPVQNWNSGKQQEFADRKTFRLAGAFKDDSAEY
jgi:anaerobic ribonucleoside-triphosphate reductase